MRKILLGISFLVLAFGCDDFADTNSPNIVDTEQFEPIFITRENLNNSIQFISGDQALEMPGKIYRYKNFLLIADHFTGVHAYDNTNPESPQKLGYIKIPGVTDIAMNGNVMYANNSVDLVAIDISDLQNLKVINRIEDSFEEPLPPNFNRLPDNLQKENRSGNLVIIKWRESND